MQQGGGRCAAIVVTRKSCPVCCPYIVNELEYERLQYEVIFIGSVRRVVLQVVEFTRDSCPYHTEDCDLNTVQKTGRVPMNRWMVDGWMDGWMN